jgi:hypothetical protein
LRELRGRRHRRVLGFPDSARDADLLSRARRTATGG